MIALTRRFVAGAAVLLLAGSVACSPLRSLEVRDDGTYTFPTCDRGVVCTDVISVQSLGVGGFVIRSGSDAVMTAPEFSHPSMLQLLRTFGSDSALVDSMFRLVDTSGIRTILVGHSHYDHLMDVPTILRYELPQARVISTPSTKLVLAGDHTLDLTRVDSVDTLSAASNDRTGQWRYIKGADGRHHFRVLAMMSTHAPNVGGWTIANSTPDAAFTELPRRPADWPKGQVYAFIIDVIRPDSTPAFRIFYQDAASDSEHSRLPPFAGRDVRRPDLAIICGGNFSGAEAYPTVVLREMKPRFTLIGHWENFFRRPTESLELIPFLKGEQLRDYVREQVDPRWATLRPFSTARFSYSFAR